MYKSVSNLKDSVAGQLQGLNLNNVTNLFVAFERTARQVCVQLDIPEAQIRSNFTMYDGVTDYVAPTTMFAKEITDLRVQGVSRGPLDDVTKQYPDQFDREKGFITSNKLTVEYDTGTGILRVVSPTPTPRIELDPMSDTAGWAVDGTIATSLAKDQTVFWQAPASLRFQLASGTGTLTKSISSNDLTDYQTVGVIFLAFYAPAVTNLTSITLRLGSDASNYYSVTATTGFLKAFTANQWQLVAFDLSTATTTGTPTITAIDYAQIRIATAGSIANFRVGDLWISLPSPHMLIFQTSAIFLGDGQTAPSASITSSSDQILLNDAAYAIYELECSINVALQQGGTLASGLIEVMSQKLNGVRGYRGVLVQPGLLDLYRADNPSESLRTVGNYYEGLNG